MGAYHRNQWVGIAEIYTSEITKLKRLISNKARPMLGFYY